MSNATLVKPDREFVEELIASGGSDLKKCFQCATCSVACELATGTHPFPRKEMIWAQWGLRDRLVADPDVWLCHQCNDCSTRCPRGARPGDVLAAVRQQAIRYYAVPGFMAKWVSQIKFIPLLLLIPALLLVAAILARDPINAMLNLGEPHGFYAELYPHWLLIGFFNFFTGLAALLLLIGAVRFWRGMSASAHRYGLAEPGSGFVGSVIATLRSVLAHDRFTKCQRHVSRRWAHLMIFWGFAALFFVTVWAVCDIYVFPFFGIESQYPFNLIHPLKIVGNVGAVALIYGCIQAIRHRLGGIEEMGRSTAFDWVFVWLLLAVGITGVMTEVMRFVAEPAGGTALTNAAYAIYFVHLVLVFGLLVYLPYSKFAHIVFHALARVFAEHVGRDRVPELPRPAAPAPGGELPTESSDAEAKQLIATP